MHLSQWQEQLAGHFEELCSVRAAAQRLVFGLEHGLSQSEVGAMRECMLQNLQESFRGDYYSLPWVVHASEIGYLFSGGEFWQTFEAQTPGWETVGDRHWIKNCFLQFRDRYKGAQPSGPWARHFSIICWPITHAILPQDLQRQLAKVLYGLRHLLGDGRYDSPAELGQLIASHSWDTTSRFQQLVQEPSLIGQVAAALLRTDQAPNNELILASTLARVRDDIDRVRRAKFWLRAAQQQVHQRATLRGLHSARQRTARAEAAVEHRPQPARLPIKPHLQLRATEKHGWSVRAEFPDYSAVLSWFPETKTPLASSRIFVQGSSGAPIAPRGLLYGPRSVRLVM